MNAAYKKIVIALLIALLGAAVGYRWLQRAEPSAGAGAAAEKSERKVLYWYDPMVPAQHFDKPGQSPFMDMQLVPKYADEQSAHSGASAGVRIDSTTQQHLAVRTALVERASVSAPITAVGTIVFDERYLMVLQARANGFVQKVHVYAVGESVQRNAALVDLLVPEWAGVQAELHALKNSGDAQLLDAVRARALALGMQSDQIATIEKTGKLSPVFTVRAPQAGVIRTLDVREGMTIGSGAALLTLNGIERVWFEMAVPEQAAATLQLYQKISIKPNTGAAKTLDAVIVALLPALNEVTRTVRVRAELDNKNGELRIGQFAQATIAAGATTLLSVPAEAVIRGGAGDRVIVVLDDGSFAPQQVEIGREVGASVEILAGLKEGQRIVASGQFLIDSEASLSGEATRMLAPAPMPAPTVTPPPTAPAPAPHEDDHGAHQHD